MLLGIKRIYDKASFTDGKRILVERLWPRGVRKSTANVDMWLKEVAPSDGLRQWFGHDTKKWTAFKVRYKKELSKNGTVKTLANIAKNEDITLVYATKDEKHNSAIILAVIIEQMLKKSSDPL